MSQCPIDAHAAQLHRAGWSAGDFATAAGWTVLAVNGENVVRVTAATQTRAWRSACEQAVLVMPPARSVSGGS